MTLPEKAYTAAISSTAVPLPVGGVGTSPPFTVINCSFKILVFENQHTDIWGGIYTRIHRILMMAWTDYLDK